MKARALDWTHDPADAGFEFHGRVLVVDQVMQPAVRFAGSTVARFVLAMILVLALAGAGAFALTDPELAQMLQAIIWVSGFVFLGFAVEKEGEIAALCGTAGFTQLLLALLSSYFKVEFAMVGVLVVAAWVAGLILSSGSHDRGQTQ